MRTLTFIIILFIQPVLHHAALAELTIVSWDIREYGQSRDDLEIQAIAQVLRHADILVLHEIVASHPAGAQALGRLASSKVLDFIGLDKCDEVDQL